MSPEDRRQDGEPSVLRGPPGVFRLRNATRRGLSRLMRGEHIFAIEPDATPWTRAAPPPRGV